MAEEKTPKTPAPAPAAVPPVFLYLGHPHTRFELGGVGLPDLVPEGTAYAPSDADKVRTMCLKYGIRFHEAE